MCLKKISNLRPLKSGPFYKKRAFYKKLKFNRFFEILCYNYKIIIEYMKNKLFIFVVIILIVVVALVLRIFSPKNIWLCEGGKWVKRGNPQTAMPTSECYDDMSMDKEIKELSALFDQLNQDKNDVKDEANVEEDLNRDIKRADDNSNEAFSSISTNLELFAPKPGETITSPYQIRGFARGDWFFEANFPVLIKSFEGDVLLETYASAQSDWMTESMVPFIAELSFDITETQDVLLVLKKDNPSGLVENDVELSYPITISK